MTDNNIHETSDGRLTDAERNRVTKGDSPLHFTEWLIKLIVKKDIDYLLVDFQFMIYKNAFSRFAFQRNLVVKPALVGLV